MSFEVQSETPDISALTQTVVSVFWVIIGSAGISTSLSAPRFCTPWSEINFDLRVTWREAGPPTLPGLRCY